MTHIVSAALTHLQRDYAEDDGEDGWRSFPALESLSEWLESKGIAHWADEGFDPEYAATVLYPHKIE